MIVTHADGPEHRIVVSMTPLEAELLLRDQPVVRREAKRGIRSALSGCEQRINGRDRAKA